MTSTEAAKKRNAIAEDTRRLQILAGTIAGRYADKHDLALMSEIARRIDENCRGLQGALQIDSFAQEA